MRLQKFRSLFFVTSMSLGMLSLGLASCGQQASDSSGSANTAPAPRTPSQSAAVAGSTAVPAKKGPTAETAPPAIRPLNYTWQMRTPVTRDGLAPHGPTLRAALIQTMQSESANSADYAMSPAGSDSLRADSPAQDLSTTWSAHGAHIAASRDGVTSEVNFRLSSIGCSSDGPKVASVVPKLRGSRVQFERGDVVEWYQNGKLGVEQGFDIKSPPSCKEGNSAQPLVLALDIEHALHAELVENRGEQWIELRDANQQVVLRYSDLYAEDSTGKPLPAKLALSGKRVTLSIDEHDAQYPVRIDPLIWAQVGLVHKSLDPNMDDLFGASVAVSSDHAAVGAPFDDEAATDAGAGYIFQLTGQGIWTQQVKILGPMAGAMMGTSVAIDDATSGNKRAVFGSPGDTDMVSVFGSAAWFVGTGSSFTPDGAFGGTGNFGSAVAISSTRIIIGGPVANGGDGLAVVLKPDPMLSPPWIEEDFLFGNIGSAEGFGGAVGMDGDVAVVGAPHNNETMAITDSGVAYVHERDPMTGLWGRTGTLYGSDEASGDHLGASVAVSGRSVIAGAPDKTAATGGAYVFVSALGVWAQQARLHTIAGAVPAVGDKFGVSVDIAGNLLAVGASGTNSSTGAVYVMTRSSSTWSLDTKVLGKTPIAGEAFGAAVSVDSSGSRILVGATGNNGGGGSHSGAFYEIIRRKSNGDPCLAATECASDFCVDGVCCNTSCGGGVDSDCQACTAAKGATADGVCGNAPAGLAFVCRPAAAGGCDVAEVCPGGTNQCPADSFQTAATVCRAAVAGGCDVAENCTGASAVCPADVVQNFGTMCRPSAGGCDVAEICNGVNNTCPGDARVPAGITCRGAAGLCDVAEVCDGTTVACPADVFMGAATVCRASAGACDVAESCNGLSAACPADTFVSGGTTCRAAIPGGCDVAESCTGSSAACPTDVVIASGTTCRAAGGVCDRAEVCDGTSGACPGDVKVSAGVVCRNSAGICDVAEACDGLTNNCPMDSFVSGGTVCRASAGICDVAESCTGSAAACPADTFVSAGTTCRAAIPGGCDVAESCTGSAAACPNDVVMATGTTCRAAGGVCDRAEVCDGTSGACPGDVKVSAGVVCRNAAGICDVAEVCDGATNNCPMDSFMSAASVCRPSAGICDVAENCTGSTAACPADTFVSAATVCRAAIPGGCDVAESCTGSAAACPNDVVMASGTTCRAAGGVCDRAELCDGTSGACPGDVKVSAGVVCRNIAGVCDVAEVCDGATNNCPPDSFASSATTCRPSAGICDVAEMCSGAGAACPPDSFMSAATVCRAAIPGGCDVAEMCSGATAACPPDIVRSTGTVCRAAGGICDRAEVCDGTSGACPGDVKVSAGVVCRLAADICDVAEACDGATDACPADGFMPNTVVCRASAGVCDVAENCTGSGVACPGDAYMPATAVCRPAIPGGCDLAENCTGTTVNCPADTVEVTGTVCRPAGGICDRAEVCDGTSGACPGDVKVSAAVTCRPAVDDCDITEACDGVNNACPTDNKSADGSLCSAGTCRMAMCRVEADLVVAAAPSPRYSEPMPQLGYTIGVGNVGRSPTDSATLDITVPTGTRLNSGSGDGWACETKSDTVIECTHAALAVGDNTLITMSLTPPSGADSLDITATVTSSIFDPVTSNNTVTVSESLLSPRYAGGGVGCSAAPAAAGGGSLWLLLGLFGPLLLTFRRRRSA